MVVEEEAEDKKNNFFSFNLKKNNERCGINEEGGRGRRGGREVEGGKEGGEGGRKR